MRSVYRPFCREKLSFLNNAWMGGLPTIRSYLRKAGQAVCNALVGAVPGPHVELLSNYTPFFETNDFREVYRRLDYTLR